MIQSNQKTSLLIPSQLPEFIRDNPDYDKFVAFLQAYYEWMEQNGNVLERSKNILNYRDIDRTTDEFINYFINDFFPYFPEESLVSKREAVKIAKQLYGRKGTPASYHFLFRMLYNSDCELFNTEEAVLIASSGDWYQPKYLNVSTVDRLWLDIKGYKIFGETTKAIALIENSILGGIEGLETQVFISNIERQFQSGEYVIIVDNQLQPILFNGAQLRAQVVGQILSITVDKDRRGLQYDVGDPVIINGGLNSGPTTGAANAIVSKVTQGSIQRIDVITGGYGYRPNPNTILHLSDAPGARAIVGSVDTNPSRTINVSIIALNDIQPSINTVIGANSYTWLDINSGGANANGIVMTTENGDILVTQAGDTLLTEFINTTGLLVNVDTILRDALDFLSYPTYPISSVLVLSSGTGIKKVPTVVADSIYLTDVPTPNVVYPDADTGHLKSLGILGPVLIANGGSGYVINDTVSFIGGRGWGAYANVSNVSGSGAITGVIYIEDPSPTRLYPPGGMGYVVGDMPTVVVTSNTGINASLYVPTILGDGATFSVVTDTIGAILKIDVTDGGKNYISKPNVSLKINDISVTNVSLGNLPIKDDIVFQGPDLANATYSATVNSISILEFSNPRKFNLRVFDYTTAPNPILPLKISHKNISMNIIPYTGVGFENYNANGIRQYGDGTALAYANFENGLSSGKGQFLSGKGQPSGFSVLENEIYNTFTYEILVEKEISKYRDILLNLLHPTGMQVLGKFILRAEQKLDISMSDVIYQGHPIQVFTGLNTYVTLEPNGSSSNLLTIHNISISNIANVLFTNDFIRISSNTGPNIQSEILVINWTANTIALKENVWLAWANVAYTRGISGTNVISILGFTNAYNIVNGGVYAYPNTPILDMLHVGDTITLSNNHSCINVGGPVVIDDWWATYGDYANLTYTYGSSVVYDSLGNLYVTGGIDANTTAFDDACTSTLIADTMIPQPVLLKYNGLGVLVWQKIISDNSAVMFSTLGNTATWQGIFEWGEAVAIDNNDNVYLTIDTSNIINQNTGYGGIIKIDNNGNKVFANVFNVGSPVTACVSVTFSMTDIVVAPNTHEIYITGTVSDTRIPEYNLSPAPQQMYVAKLDNNTNIIWGRSLYQDGYDHTTTLTLSAGSSGFVAGEVVYQSSTGLFNDTDVIAQGSVYRYDGANNLIYIRNAHFVTWDAVTFTTLRSLQTTNTRTVSAITATDTPDYGTHSATIPWKQIATRGYGIKIDAGANVYVVGENFVPYPGYATGNTYIVLAKYDPSGNLLWHTELGNKANVDTSVFDANTNATGGLGLALDSNNNIYVVGATNFGYPKYNWVTGFQFPPNASTQLGEFRANTSALIVKYNNNGQLQWQRRLGAEGQVARSIVIDSNNDIFIAGTANSVHDWDPPSAGESGGGFLTMNPSGRSTSNLFVACYSANGNLNWQRTIGTGSDGMQYAWGTRSLATKQSKLAFVGYSTGTVNVSSLIVSQIDKSGNSIGTWGNIVYTASSFANSNAALNTISISMGTMPFGWQGDTTACTMGGIINITNFPGYANASIKLSSNVIYLGNGSSSNTSFQSDNANIIVTFIDTGNNLIYLDRILCTTANSYLSVNRPAFQTSNVIIFKQLGLVAN